MGHHCCLFSEMSHATTSLMLDVTSLFLRGNEERLSTEKSVRFVCLEGQEASDKRSLLVYSFSCKVNASYDIK